MSKHIQQVSHYAPHERIKTFLIKRNNSHSNLTEGSAQSRLGAEVVEEGAKASRIILYLCTKPKTSEMVLKHFHAIVEVKKFFPRFPSFLRELQDGLLYAAWGHYWAVLKNRYFRPWSMLCVICG